MPLFFSSIELTAKLSFGAGELFFGRGDRLDEFVESVMMEQPSWYSRVVAL